MTITEPRAAPVPRRPLRRRIKIRAIPGPSPHHIAQKPPFWPASRAMPRVPPADEEPAGRLRPPCCTHARCSFGAADFPSTVPPRRPADQGNPAAPDGPYCRCSCPPTSVRATPMLPARLGAAGSLSRSVIATMCCRTSEVHSFHQPTITSGRRLGHRRIGINAVADLACVPYKGRRPQPPWNRRPLTGHSGRSRCSPARPVSAHPSLKKTDRVPPFATQTLGTGAGPGRALIIRACRSGSAAKSSSRCQSRSAARTAVSKSSRVSV
ncbi:hypothetical protein GA0115254_106210 [Streptomyces sp. Ncost-T10-10d]|nr:hypothetical protein GA0115254_106210 [Streptomyces sp. Ncost-T10-10d]